MNWSEAFAPLRERNFAWFYGSRFVNLLGQMMATIALAYAVLDIEDSASALGQVLAAHTVPLVVFLLFGGVIADRFPRVVVLQFSNLASALAQGTVAFLVVSGTAELWMLLVLEAVHGLVSAISIPAMSSLVPQLVPRSQLQQTNSLMSLSRGGLAVIGPSTGALLVVTVGPGWALGFDALTWFLAALALTRVRIPAGARAGKEAGTLRELREGWGFFRRTTWLWVIVLAFGVLNAIHVGAWFTLGPAVAEDTIGRQGWGFVLSAESVGLVAMTLVLLRVRLRRPLFTGMIGMSSMSVPFFVLGAEPRLGVLVAVAFLAGAGTEVFTVGWNLAMQENIDENMLSRAYSYDALGSYVAMPVGQLLYGPLGELFGNREVLMASGVGFLVVCVLTIAARSIRAVDRVEAAEQVAAGGAAAR